MSNKNIVFLLLVNLISLVFSQQQTDWRSCEDEIQATPVVSDEIKVFVPQCVSNNATNETRCLLKKGFDANITVQFKPKMSVPSVERVIVAKLPAIAGKMIEMPYGPAASICTNSSTVADDGSDCVENGIVANKSYTYTFGFKILKSFPTVQNITTKVIIRQKHDKHSKIRLYKKHPGPTIACIVLHNIEVID